MKCTECGSFVSGNKCKICPSPVQEKSKPKPIRKKSLKMVALDKIYMVLRNKFLEENKICAVNGTPATDVHHKRGRIGKNYLDVTTFLAVSREGHKKIEENPEWAREMGYSESRLKTT